MSSLSNLIQECFETHTEEPCIWVRERFWSFAEIYDLALNLADRLAQDTPETKPIGILAQRSLAAYVGILGSVLAGRPYVPLNMKFPYERQHRMATLSGCAILVSDSGSYERHKELAAALGHAGPLLTDAFLQTDSDPSAECDLWRRPGNGRTNDDRSELDETHPAYIMFTSGTTGAPKGVVVRRENLAGYLEAVAEAVPMPERARCSHLFDLSFDLSVHDIFRTWCAGGCLFVMREEELLDPIGFAARHELDCWFSVPSVVAMANRMRRLKPGLLPSLRLSLFCGEPLPFSLAEAWRSVAPNSRILNLYGPTEATIAITAQDLSEIRETERRPATVPLGTPFPGAAAVVITEAGAPARCGESGELWLGGRQITDGYLNNSGETNLKFVERSVAGSPYGRWYRTGDVVSDDPDFGLVFQGRLDDQVKIQGYRVELLEIEEALRAASGTADVAAVVWPISDQGQGEGVVGFVCGNPLAPEAIVASCRLRLPNYMTPKKIISVDSIPLNANGKVDRRLLRETYLQSPVRKVS
jgi:D-alanine--poly(phosphoribitol) ligase subunit 1